MKQFKSLFISDIHLGTPVCKAKLLLDFLKHHKTDNLYLVGDIIETWHLKKWYSDKYQDKLIKKLQHIARKCDKAYYIVGNHDQPFTNIAKSILSDFKFTTDDLIYYTLDKKKILITHGHKFDTFISNFVLIRYLYRYINRWTTYKVIHKIHDILDSYQEARINKYRTKAITHAKLHLCDGILVGHSHISDYIQLDNIMYFNTGCWVEDNCTAIVENSKGQMEIIKWPKK
jgi:UDP-2,3-diacylglucosamine pyrophosphatase LpxH